MTKCSISQFVVVVRSVPHTPCAMPIMCIIRLHTACWQNEYSKRPAFSEVLRQLRDIEREEFMTSTNFDDFASMQSTWKSEIQEQFLKFKREESVSQLSNYCNIWDGLYFSSCLYISSLPCCMQCGVVPLHVCHNDERRQGK